jgi:ribosome-binding factor A
MSRRTERVAALLKQEICRIVLQELRDPRMGFVTITQVKPSADLRLAKVYYSVLGSETQRRNTAHALRQAHAFIQTELSSSVYLRYVPVLSFHYDPSLAEVDRIGHLLDQVAGGATADEIDRHASDQAREQLKDKIVLGNRSLESRKGRSGRRAPPPNDAADP